MATVTSVVSPTAGQWKYVDSTSIEHTVTTSQTFSLTIDDNSATDVRYRFNVGSTSVTTNDGYKLELRPRTDMSQVGTATTGNHQARYVGPLTDALQGTNLYNVAGEFRIVCSVNGVPQDWKIAQINTSDADFGAAGTLVMTLEDQFGNVMNMPFQRISTLAVAQAA